MLSKTKMKRMFEVYFKADRISPYERNLLQSALEMTDTMAHHIMTKIENTFMVSIESELDKTLIRKIYEAGYSRIPVYEGERTNIIGVLMIRDLILIKPEHKVLTIG